MINKSKIRRIVSLSLMLAGAVLVGGYLTNVSAQTGGRDPFGAPAWKRKTAPVSTAPSKPGQPGQPRNPKTGKPIPPPVIPVGAPAIEQRINYYKQMRLQAAESGQPIPKVTSVLTLEEMSVTGIVKTPRGYAALIEAKPIDLSYTIYPGEKFFDGQLVAIEENRLVFRKVIKMSNGKFIASVENKPIREYTDREQITGTAPIQPSEKPTESAANVPPAAAPTGDAKPNAATPSKVISPLDEMEHQPTEKSKDSAKKEKADKTDKKGKKPVKVARKQ